MNFNQLKTILERGLRERKEYEDALEAVDLLVSFEQEKSKLSNEIKLLQEDLSAQIKELESAKEAVKKEKTRVVDTEAKALADAAEIISDAQEKAANIIGKAEAYKDEVDEMVSKNKAKDKEREDSIKVKIAELENKKADLENVILSLGEKIKVSLAV